MGTTVPPDEFEIDPAKNYNVTLDTWNWFPGIPRCDGFYQGKYTCGKTGAEIVAWLDGGNECSDNPLCAPPLTEWAQRIFSIIEV